MLFQGLERPDHILGCQWRSIRKLCLRAQFERHALLVGSNSSRFRDQSVDAVRFVPGTHHKLVKHRQSIRGAPKSLRRIPLHNEAVEAVERNQSGGADHTDCSAFGSVWIYVIEVLEICRVLELAKRRKSMLGDTVGKRRHRA